MPAMSTSRRDFPKFVALLSGATGISGFVPSSIQRSFAIEPTPGTSFVVAEHISHYNCRPTADNGNFANHLRPALPHTRPIGSRQGRLPSDRCIRSTPLCAYPAMTCWSRALQIQLRLFGHLT